MFENNKQKFLILTVIAISAAVSLLSGAAGYYIFAKLRKPAKMTAVALNLKHIVDLKKKEIQEEALSDPNIKPREITKQITVFLKKVNADAKQMAGKNVILVHQAVIGGNVKNITAPLEIELKKQGVL